jgi:hypothetical protein
MRESTFRVLSIDKRLGHIRREWISCAFHSGGNNTIDPE